jgi:hypothetical protein
MLYRCKHFCFGGWLTALWFGGVLLAIGNDIGVGEIANSSVVVRDVTMNSNLAGLSRSRL